MSQTRTQSAVEVALNIASGMAINVALNIVVLPRFGFEVSTYNLTVTTLIYTVASVARSYFWRRFCNWWHRPREKNGASAVPKRNTWLRRYWLSH